MTPVDPDELRARLGHLLGRRVGPIAQRPCPYRTSYELDEVDVWLLFRDVRDFTTYSEQAKPQDVVTRLNDLYGAVPQSVSDLDGQLGRLRQAPGLCARRDLVLGIARRC